MQTLSQYQTRRCGKATIADRVAAVFLLILFCPVLILISAAIMLETPGSVFARTTARDDHNNEVKLWYFRTMRDADADGSGSAFTRVGAFLHTSRLETLPSLVNCLHGQMSISHLMV